MSVDLRNRSAAELRALGITSPVGYDPAGRVPGSMGAEQPPTIPQSWIPFRGRWLTPRGYEIKGGAEPVMVLGDNPNRYGAWLFNAGGQIELPVALPLGAAGQLALAQFLDSGSVGQPTYALSSYKALYLIVDVQLAWAVGAQATLQLIVGRQPWGPSSGAGTQVGSNFYNAVKGAVANLGGAAATTLAVGIYAFSPADIGDLQWPHPHIGAELKFGSALTAGFARLVMETPGGPMIVVGGDNSINPGAIGARANSFGLPAQGSPVLWQGAGELWAAATPGGNADLRVQEIVIVPPDGAGAL
jgi:hypothetical protein